MAVSATAAPAVPAVAGQVGEAAAAVQGPPFTMHSLSIIAQSQDFMQDWKRNNTCIKYCRHLGGQDNTVPYVADFDLRQCYNIGVIDHDKAGPAFSFAAPAVAGQFQNGVRRNFFALYVLMPSGVLSWMSTTASPLCSACHGRSTRTTTSPTP